MEFPLSSCGSKKFAIDPFDDHVSTCTTHSDAKKAHDWAVDLLADLFHSTHKVDTQQVVRSRGQRCGDIELTGYLVKVVGPVPVVLDLVSIFRCSSPLHNLVYGRRVYLNPFHFLEIEEIEVSHTLCG